MDKMDMIAAALSKGDELPDEPTMKVGMMNIKKAMQWSQEASARPNPTPLWLSLWYEGEACVLFADTNLGKSILAVQIAEHIARNKGHRVLYFDFELSDKQFQLRYTDEGGNLYRFSDNLFRAEIDPSSMMVSDFEEAVVDAIEEAATQCEASIIIIDNLTYLCTAAEKGDMAGALMMRLMQMKKNKALSFLVLAHTPKRQLSSPITQNDLAGSKKLINFFDSSFAIGKSAVDTSLRYIKQIKCRHGEFEHDADNVIVCQIEKRDSFLQYATIGYASESEHLKALTADDEEKRNAEVKALHIAGKSQRDIAKEVGTSLSSVNRILKKGGSSDG